MTKNKYTPKSESLKFQSFAIDHFISKSIDPKRYKLLNKFKLDIVQVPINYINQSYLKLYQD